ncbi:enoyl-CoA hydratase/isomerase family protein [Halobacillus fulvus]|nr:enoyl-CoA hydratase/isomerase family protein [Halobacillus fulvus]
MSFILTDIKQEGYGVLTLNRPEKRNALHPPMIEELKGAMEQIKKEEALKFLVLTGNGDQAFCAGGDLNAFHGEMPSEEAYQLLRPMKDVLYDLATFPIPTIAVLQGQARGGGCELATACDFRYGLNEASFGFIQGNLGIAPGWGGGALLYKRIRADLAAHWLMDSEMYSASKAQQIGWLHKTGDREQLTSAEMFESFIRKSREQMKVFKQQYIKQLNVAELARDMEEEVRECSVLWESEEHIQAVRRFMDSKKTGEVDSINPS